MQLDGTPTILAYTAHIVSAHIRCTATGAEELPALIRAVHAALASIDGDAAGVANSAQSEPAPETVFPDYLICLEDGRALKTLKRHLQTNYGLTPEAYRAKWKLPPDYPMVAPSYAEKRSALAKTIGLGRKSTRAAAAATAAPTQSEEPGCALVPPGAEEAEARGELSADAVFANFPRAQKPDEDSEAAPAVARRSARTPFAQQMARTMRR